MKASKRRFVLGAFAVIGALVWILLPERRSPPPSTRSTGGEDSAPSTSRQAPGWPIRSRTDDGGPPVPAGDRRPASEATGRARLRLICRLRVSGENLKGLPVEVRMDRSPEMIRAVTDEAGVAALEVAAGTLRAVHVSRTPDVPEQWVSFERRVDPGPEVSIVVPVDAGWYVNGRVVTDDKTPVARAMASTLDGGRSVAAAEDGSFRIGPFASPVELLGNAVGFAAESPVRVDANAGVPDLVDLVVYPAVALEGRVTSSGAPVPAAQVAARRGSWVAGRATTDAAGRFSIVISPHACEVSVDCAGYVPWMAAHDPANGPLEVELSRGAVLQGVVLDERGAAVGRARVALSVDGPGDCPDQVTGDDGRFRFEGIQDAAGIELRVRADGFFLFGREGEILAGVNEWPVRLERCAPIHGTVLDEGGDPAEGIHVYIGTSPHVSPMNSEHVVETDARGRFRYGTAMPGVSVYYLVAAASFWDDPTRRSRVVEAALGDEVTLRLDPTAFRGVAFKGTVRDARSGQPVERFMVLYRLGNGGTGHLYHDGTFERAGFPSDRPIGIVVRSDDHVPFESDPALYEPGEHFFDVTLVPRCQVVFRLIHAGGSPAPDAMLRVLDERGRALTQRTSSQGGSIAIGSTRGDGLVVARDVPAGPCSIAVAPYRNGPETTYPFDFTTPPSAPVDLVVERVRFAEWRVRVYAAVAVEDGSGTTEPGREERGRRTDAAVSAFVDVRGDDWRLVASGETTGGEVTLRVPDLPVRFRVSSGARSVTVEPSGEESLRRTVAARLPLEPEERK